MPTAVRPRPIRAPAVMIAPHNARICHPSRQGRGRSRPATLDPCLLPQHPHAATQDEQYAGQDDQDTATAATHPRSARPLRVEIIAPAQEAASARSHAHEMTLSMVANGMQTPPCPYSGAILPSS